MATHCEPCILVHLERALTAIRAKRPGKEELKIAYERGSAQCNEPVW